MLVRSSQLPPSDWLAWWLECGRGQVQVCGDLTRHVATSSTAVTSQHLHFLSPAQPSQPGLAQPRRGQADHTAHVSAVCRCAAAS